MTEAPLSAEQQPAATENLQTRARHILGLEEPEGDCHRLSPRVEYLWRAEHFASMVPFAGSVFVPLGRAPDLGVVKDCIATVARRHEVLRSRLALQDGRPVLLVGDFAPRALDVVEVTRAQIAAHREGGPPSALSEFAEIPIDLYAESEFRCRGFRDEDGNVVLGIVLHHYFGDGWSSQILKREITALYAALMAGQNPDLPPAAQYGEFALAQRRALDAKLPALLSYWGRRLENAKPSSLPYDHRKDTDRMGRLFFVIPDGLAAALRALSGAERVSLSIIILAAFQLALARWGGTNDIVTAVNAADRASARFRDTVGYLMASIPVRTSFAETDKIRALLAVVARAFYDGYGHRELSYDLYDAIFAPPGPFCPVLFNFIPLLEKVSPAYGQAGAPALEGTIAGPDVQRVKVHREIYLCVVELPHALTGKIYFNRDFFEAETIDALVVRFQAILRDIAANPDGTLNEIR